MISFDHKIFNPNLVKTLTYKPQLTHLDHTLFERIGPVALLPSGLRVRVRIRVRFRVRVRGFESLG